jgi:hypothetical protein
MLLLSGNPGAGNPGETGDLLIPGNFIVSGAIWVPGALLFPGVVDGKVDGGAFIEGAVTPGEFFGSVFSGLKGYF